MTRKNPRFLARWNALRRDERALAFLAALRAGKTIYTAYKEATPNQSGEHRYAEEAVAYFMQMQERFPGLMRKFASRGKRRKLAKLLVEANLQDSLTCESGKRRLAAMANARAVYGLDAPTEQKLTVTNPHLDLSPIVPVPRPSERFKALLEN